MFTPTSGLEEGICCVPHPQDRSVVLLPTSLHVLMVCRSGEEPRNLALAVCICCFGLPSIPPLEKCLPSCHVVCEDVNQCAACCKDGIITQAELTTGPLPWQHALSKGWWGNDANRTNQNPSLRRIYTPWENKCSLLAGVPKLVECNFETCTSHLLSHMEKLKLQNKLRV